MNCLLDSMTVMDSIGFKNEKELKKSKCGMGITNDQFPFIFLMVLNDPKCKEKSRQDLLIL